jgi:hypothetical protein
VSAHATKACRGNRVIAPLIPNLGAKLKREFSFTSPPVYPRERNPYPFNRRLGGPQRHLDIVEKRKMSCPNRDSNPGNDIWVEKTYNEELRNAKSSSDSGMIRRRMKWAGRVARMVKAGKANKW